MQVASGIPLLLLLLAHCDAQDMQYCCRYCRSDPKQWVTLASTFDLSTDSDVTKMASPAAYLVGDLEEAEFQIEERHYKIRYAGAPLYIRHEDFSDSKHVLNDQYIQIDLATPKTIGGVLTQGGFYEERIKGLFPREVTWASSFVLSFSNSSTGFVFYRTWDGHIKTFEGNADSNSVVLNPLGGSVTSRYIRYHPLKGRNKDGSVRNVNVRVTPITCSKEVCVIQKINCLMTNWENWSECRCVGASCTQRRKRSVVRIQACGGVRCGSPNQIQTCEVPEPLWGIILRYLSICFGVIIVLLIIGFVAFRKSHRSRVEVILVQEPNSEAVRTAGDYDYDVNDEADDIKDFEGRGMKNGGFQNTTPKRVPPPYTEARARGLVQIDM